MKAINKNGLYLAAVLTLSGLLGGCGLASGYSDPGSVLGAWQLESINGERVVKNSPARIEFLDDGRVVGNASCNRFFGQYQVQSERLTIDDALGATRMMCLPELMEQEQALLVLLPGSHNILLDNQTLVLSNENGELMRAVKVTQ